MTARERIEIAAARSVLHMPSAVKRRIAGPPIVRDGLELDLDTQVLLKLAERDPVAPLRTLTPQQAREQLARSARHVEGAAPAPAAVEDALAAFRDVLARAEELGSDAARIAVAGDSAGGHLAAVTAQLAAAEGGAAPAFQLLIYPATNSAEVSGSRSTFAEGFLLTKENMDWYEENFIGEHDRRDPRISPLLAESLAGVAPAMVVTAGFDPLRDEGEAYAHKLREHGVPVTLRRHPGFVHGFTHILLAGYGPRVALAEMGGAVRAALAGVGAAQPAAGAGAA